MAESIATLMEDLSHKTKTLEDIAEKAEREGERNFHTSENEEIDAINKDIEDLNTKIKQREAHEARLDQIKAITDAAKRPRAAPLRERKTVPADPGDEPVERTRVAYPRQHKRCRKLRAFPNTPEGEDMAFRSGRWLQANLGGELAYRWCAKNDIEVRAMSEGINTAGGVLVPDELSQRIIDNRETHGVYRQHAYIEPMGSDVKDIGRQTGGLTAYFVAEGASTTESDSAWDNVKLVAKKLAAETRLSSELDEDAAIDLADRFAMDAARALALKEDQCGFNGTGASTFGGIHGLTVKLNDGNHTASVYSISGTKLFSEITNTHLDTILGMLPEYAAPNAAWFCSRVCWALVFQRLAQAAGGNTIETIAGGRALSYAGYPIVISQVLPAITTTLNGSVMFMFGDLEMAATLGDRRSIALAKSEHVHWTTDQIALRATERIDIQNHDLGDTSDAGAVVGFVGLT